MNERKRILILGNGFDLAHLLPTKYEHFITAMRAVEGAPLNETLSFDNIFRELLIDEDFFLGRTKEIYKTENVSMSLESLIVLKEKLLKNGWFKYFKDYLDSGIDTWIDFENEIKNVLDIVCSVLNRNSDKNEIIDTGYYEVNLNIVATDFFKIFNINEDHYINVLLKMNLLREVYIFQNNDKFIEIEENQFNSIETGFDYNPETGINMIRSKSKKLCLNDDYVKRYKGKTTGIQTYKVIKDINDQLLSFIDIFSKYIELVEALVPRENLKRPKAISGLKQIYSFNYSSTIDRLYNVQRTKFLHGKVGEDNIVLGISELENQLLIDEKAYGFVKYYQKLVNNTDYQFLSGNSDLIKLEKDKVRTTIYGATKLFEIYVWGHSLDSSDSDYIKEIFSFNKGNEVSLYLVIYYFPSPHAQLANLISIMGKDIIEIWMKKGWLEFVKAPDIYDLNNTEGYVDELSKHSERGLFK